MNRNNLALGLMLVGCVVVTGCDKTTVDPPPVDEDGGIPDTTCVLDGDMGTQTFVVRALRIPTKPNPEAPLPTVGFDIDGRTSTASDLAGCNKADLPGGVDNGLANIIAGLGGVLSMANVDINAELQTAVAGEAIDLEVVISDWNETATDGCVVVTLQGDTGGEPITPLVGRAGLAAGFMDIVTFGADLTITPSFQVSPDGGLGMCTSGCIPVDLDITIQDVVARLRFSDDMTDLVVGTSPNNTNSTMVGGYVRYTGTDAAAFSTSLGMLIDAIDPSLAPTVANIFGQFLDLDSTPSLSACTAVGNGTSADTFSAAILASSIEP